MQQFRVWNKKDLKWANDTAFLDTNGVLYKKSALSIKLDKSGIINFNTCKKDKNDSYIFEMDILRNDDDSLNIVIFNEDIKSYLFVKLTKVTSEQDNLEAEQIKLNDLKFGNYEVVGNIYENYDMIAPYFVDISDNL